MKLYRELTENPQDIVKRGGARDIVKPGMGTPGVEYDYQITNPDPVLDYRAAKSDVSDKQRRLDGIGKLRSAFNVFGLQENSAAMLPQLKVIADRVSEQSGVYVPPEALNNAFEFASFLEGAEAEARAIEPRSARRRMGSSMQPLGEAAATRESSLDYRDDYARPAPEQDYYK